MAKKSEYLKMMLVGQQMSNLCFNLSQSSQIPANYRATMKELYQEWDDAYPSKRTIGDAVAASPLSSSPKEPK